ncbi:MAG: hypothetical protein V1656_01250 [Candidatus Jorgensenbacteria bacterium]
MDKKLLRAVAVAVVLIAVGYWYWDSTRVVLTSEQQALQGAGDTAQAITDSATQGVLPSLDVPPANPVGDATNVNPVTKTNPFSGIKTNPFQ